MASSHLTFSSPARTRKKLIRRMGYAARTRRGTISIQDVKYVAGLFGQNLATPLPANPLNSTCHKGLNKYATAFVPMAHTVPWQNIDNQSMGHHTCLYLRCTPVHNPPLFLQLPEPPPPPAQPAFTEEDNHVDSGSDGHDFDGYSTHSHSTAVSAEFSYPRQLANDMAAQEVSATVDGDLDYDDSIQEPDSHAYGYIEGGKLIRADSDVLIVETISAIEDCPVLVPVLQTFIKAGRDFETQHEVYPVHILAEALQCFETTRGGIRMDSRSDTMIKDFVTLLLSPQPSYGDLFQLYNELLETELVMPDGIIDMYEQIMVRLQPTIQEQVSHILNLLQEERNEGVTFLNSILPRMYHRRTQAAQDSRSHHGIWLKIRRPEQLWLLWHQQTEKN